MPDARVPSTTVDAATNDATTNDAVTPEMPPARAESTARQVSAVQAAAAAAAAAAPALARLSAAHRGALLDAAATALDAHAERIVAITRAETGLAEARVRGELGRTTGQLRLLGSHTAAGRDRPVRSSPGAAPGGVDLVAVPVPVGPVAVFAASNFPLAFGVIGGDTAAALAAGCPVVVKAHPAQPRTARLLAEVVAAVLPGGAFTLVEGGADVSIALVRSPPIRAVGFTGSLGGGRALLAAAAARPDPIPVYAEMGSVNPVFVLPGAVRDDRHVSALATAVTGSAGQLCTKPGLIVVPDTSDGTAFAAALSAAVVAAGADHPMLTEAMATAHDRWLEQARGLPGVSVDAAPAGGGARPFVSTVDAADLDGDLLEEHFGPSVVVVRCAVDTYPRVLRRLAGTLTATLLGTAADLDLAAALLPDLSTRTGRIVWNGVPTGVAVTEAMHHGGPWPATSAPWTTSVGTAAIERFLRPVALQGLPAQLAGLLTP